MIQEGLRSCPVPAPVWRWMTGFDRFLALPSETLFNMRAVFVRFQDLKVDRYLGQTKPAFRINDLFSCSRCLSSLLG